MPIFVFPSFFPKNISLPDITFPGFACSPFETNPAPFTTPPFHPTIKITNSEMVGYGGIFKVKMDDVTPGFVTNQDKTIWEGLYRVQEPPGGRANAVNMFQKFPVLIDGNAQLLENWKDPAWIHYRKMCPLPGHEHSYRITVTPADADGRLYIGAPIGQATVTAQQFSTSPEEQAIVNSKKSSDFEAKLAYVKEAFNRDKFPHPEVLHAHGYRYPSNNSRSHRHRIHKPNNTPGWSNKELSWFLS